MAKITRVKASHGRIERQFTVEERDCWRCVFIQYAMGDVMPRVCEECKWSGRGGPGPKFTGQWIEPVKDNYIPRANGRWNGEDDGE